MPLHGQREIHINWLYVFKFNNIIVSANYYNLILVQSYKYNEKRLYFQIIFNSICIILYYVLLKYYSSKKIMLKFMRCQKLYTSDIKLTKKNIYIYMLFYSNFKILSYIQTHIKTTILLRYILMSSIYYAIKLFYLG